ncbi:MAG: hypothetical protein AABY22_13145 [Nanoarchaeota archaeon]
MEKEFDLSEIWKERIKLLESESKENPKDKICEIDISLADSEKKIVGKALMNSVDRETYNYIIIKSIRECEIDVQEFIRLLKQWANDEQKNNNIYRKTTDELNNDWFDKISKLAGDKLK